MTYPKYHAERYLFYMVISSQRFLLNSSDNWEWLLNLDSFESQVHQYFDEVSLRSLDFVHWSNPEGQ